MYSQAGWKCVVNCGWECTGKHPQLCAWECVESRVGRVPSNKLWVCHQVQLGTSSKVWPGVLDNIPWGIVGSVHRVYLGVSWELTWEHNLTRLEVYFRVYLAACNEVYLAVMLNATECRVSSAHNHECMIVILSKHRPIGPHSATCYIWSEILSQKQLINELYIMQGDFSWCEC